MAALTAFDKEHYENAGMEVAMKAEENEVDQFESLTTQLKDFITSKIGQTTRDRRETTLFFEEEGRRGYLICKYFPDGTALFDRDLYTSQDYEAKPMLNISHVVIAPPPEGGQSTKNILARVCEQLIPGTHLAGIRIEAILSDGFLESLKNRGWIEYNRNQSPILRNPSPTSGGRTKRQRRRKRQSVRKRSDKNKRNSGATRKRSYAHTVLRSKR
jgi:hypothetical protein